MSLPRRTDTDLHREFTGLVVDSLAVRQDISASTVTCAACVREDGDGRLRDGDAVVVLLNEYEGFTWEIQDVFCIDHRVDSVADTVGVGTDDQAVVTAVLEAAGYHSPDGTYHPDALTLGDVEVLDYSPAEAGYAALGASRERRGSSRRADDESWRGAVDDACSDGDEP